MKRLILSIILVLALAIPGFATNYYVDTASSGGDGTTTATSGAQAAFKTVAAAEAALTGDQHGNSLLFNRGNTWREQFTVGANGTAAGQFTIGNYGTGALPIITGADVLAASGWTTAAGNKLTADANTVALYDFNQNLNDTSTHARNLTATGTPAYAASIYDYSLNAPSANATAYYSDAQSGDTNAFDFGANPFTVEVSFELPTDPGANVVLIAKQNAQSTVGYTIKMIRTNSTLSWLGINLHDGTDDCWVGDAAYTNVMGTGPHTVTGVFVPGGTSKIYLDGVEVGSGSSAAIGSCDNSLNFTVGSESDGGGKFTGKIEQVRVSNIARTSFNGIPAGGQANLWNRAVTTQPNVVIFNDTQGTLVANASAVNGASKWFWAANVLSVYSTSNPATAFTTPGVQVGVREAAIWAAYKDYITVDGLQLEGCNTSYGGDLFVYAHNTVGWTVQNCVMKNSAYDAVFFNGYNYPDTTLIDTRITNNTLISNGCGVALYRVKGTAGHEIVVSHNDISGTGPYGLGLGGVEMRSSYTIIEHNDIHGASSIAMPGGVSGGGGVHLYSGSIDEDNGDNNIIRYNTVRGNYGCQWDGYGIGLDQWCDNNQVYCNLVYKNDGPGMYNYDGIGNTFYNNTVFDNGVDTGGTGLDASEFKIIGDRSESVLVKNNIFYSNKAGTYAVWLANNFTTIDFTNNQIYKAPGGNWYFYKGTAGATLATWNGYTGVGTDKFGDPLFVSTATPDFHLRPESLLPLAGVNVGLARDFGNDLMLQNGGYPIGAYVYKGNGAWFGF